ncbi:hypothetical protein JCM24511_00637 [Saitozyma sp. JCM 24511]|nr:hypothetical protein JCM24511_00637 [Saitozyma sp. JCM 24511]
MSASGTVESTLPPVDLTPTVIYSFRSARVGHRAEFAYAVVGDPDGSSNGVTMEISGLGKPTLQSVPRSSEKARSAGISWHDALESARSWTSTLSEQYSTWYRAEKIHPKRSRQRGRIDAISQSLRDQHGTEFGLVHLENVANLEDKGVYGSNRPHPISMRPILCWTPVAAEDGSPRFRVAYGATLPESQTNAGDGQTMLLDNFCIVCLLGGCSVHVRERHQEWLDTVAVGSEMAKELSHFINTKVGSPRRRPNTRIDEDPSTVVRSFRPSSSRCLVTELPKRDFDTYENNKSNPF